MEREPRRNQRSQRVALAFAALCLLVLLGACAAFSGVLASGTMPVFYKPVWFGPRHAVMISNGPACPPGYDANPCHDYITFRINVWLPGHSWKLLSWAQKQR